MKRCPISEQIAKHCDEHEVYCEVCQGIMYYDDELHNTLRCSECGHKLFPEEPELDLDQD